MHTFIIKKNLVMVKNEKLLLFILALVQFANIVDFMIMMPLGPQLMRIFEISPQQFSLLVSSYAISAGISGFLGAFFVDKFDRKVVLLFIFIGFTIGTLCCAFAPTFYFLMSARIFTGIFGGILGSTVLAIVGDVIPSERRASAMGVVMAAFSIASIVGVPLGLFLANKFSWHAPFLFLVGISFIIIFLIIAFVPVLKNHIQKKELHANPFQIIINISKNNNQLTALLFMVFLMLGQFTVIIFISKFMVSNVGFSEDQLFYIYLIGGIVSLLAAPLSGKLSDKFGTKRIFTIFCVLTIIPLFLVTNLPPVPIYIALGVSALFFITLTGRSIPASTMATTVVLPKERGGFMSINSSVQQLSSGFASFIAGKIVYTNAVGKLENFEVVGYIAIACSLITIYLCHKIKSIEG